MKIVKNKYLPPKGFAAINLFGALFVRKEFIPLSDKTINHERIHTEQGKELLWVFFYLWYIIERFIKFVPLFVVAIVKLRMSRIKAAYKLAYYNISFEREAYAHADNLDYLRDRKRYSFVRYLKVHGSR